MLSSNSSLDVLQKQYGPFVHIYSVHVAEVQPFTVNERLFTVPVTENLLGEPLDTGNKAGRKMEPTQDNPRFVR